MSDTQAAHAMFTMVQTTTTIVWILVDVAAVVLVATVVRRHRPDVYGSLLVWAIAGLVVGIIVPIAYPIAFAVANFESSVDRVWRVQAGMTVFTTILHLGVFALLLRGLVKLAQPPKPVTTEPVGPYR